MSNTTQKQRILNDKSTHQYVVAGVVYQGRPPVYAPIVSVFSVVTGYRKISKGIPFVRVATHTGL